MEHNGLTWTTEEAFRQLRRVVAAAPEKHFDMWCFEDTKACGTVRCAAGWAGVDRWFMERGLQTTYGDVWFDGTDGFTALTAFFGISSKWADRLFLPGYDDHPVTRQMVIDNIDRVLAGREPIDYLDMQDETA